MTVFDNHSVRRDPETDDGLTVITVGEGGFNEDGTGEVSYTQDAKGKWTASDGSKVSKEWQDALTTWAAPVPTPEPQPDPNEVGSDAWFEAHPEITREDFAADEAKRAAQA